jgi:IclR family acetate operon transcriptional repressor
MDEIKSPPGRSNRTIQSVDRALDILESLSAAQNELQLNEVARETGLNVSTCHHILLTLMNRGYVGQNRRGRAYYLGAKITALSSNRARQFNLVELAMPELRALNDRTKENIHLAVMQGDNLVILLQLDSTRAVRVHTDNIDFTNAAHATAIGKSILAWLPETEIARIIENKGLAGFTRNTITDPTELIEALRLVRRFGFAIDREELLPGVVSIGTALRDYSGTVLGSVSCTLPASRAEESHVDEVKQAVIDCVTALSDKLVGPKDEPISKG